MLQLCCWVFEVSGLLGARIELDFHLQGTRAEHHLGQYSNIRSVWWVCLVLVIFHFSSVCSSNPTCVFLKSLHALSIFSSAAGSPVEDLGNVKQPGESCVCSLFSDCYDLLAWTGLRKWVPQTEGYCSWRAKFVAWISPRSAKIK